MEYNLPSHASQMPGSKPVFGIFTNRGLVVLPLIAA